MLVFLLNTVWLPGWGTDQQSLVFDTHLVLLINVSLALYWSWLSKCLETFGLADRWCLLTVRIDSLVQAPRHFTDVVLTNVACDVIRHPFFWGGRVVCTNKDLKVLNVCGRYWILVPWRLSLDDPTATKESIRHAHNEYFPGLLTTSEFFCQPSWP